jgi:hypothetical protein
MTVRERNDRRRRETKKRQRSRSTAVTHMHAKRRTKQERALGRGETRLKANARDRVTASGQRVENRLEKEVKKGEGRERKSEALRGVGGVLAEQEGSTLVRQDGRVAADVRRVNEHHAIGIEVHSPQVSEHGEVIDLRKDLLQQRAEQRDMRM